MLGCVLLAGCVQAAPPRPAPGIAEPTPAAALSLVHSLASHTWRGRATPSPELERAADSIAGYFRRAGLRPAFPSGFRQRFPVRTGTLDTARATLRLGAGAPLRWGTEFFAAVGAEDSLAAPLVLAGVAGRDTALALPDGAVPLFLLPGAAPDSAWLAGAERAVLAAFRAGAPAVGVVLDPELPAAALAAVARQLAGRTLPLPAFGLRYDALAQALSGSGFSLDSLRAHPPERPLLLPGLTLRAALPHDGPTGSAPNVAALLPGSDPRLRAEYVVVSAHFDHLGVGAPDASGDSVYNGADDDASGVAALLLAARSLAARPDRPARSILFLAVSGEEEGLLGSAAFVAHPPVPLRDVVADLNLDMVGRNAPDSLSVIGMEYSTLGASALAAASAHPELGLQLVPDRDPAEDRFFRSDQFSFARRGIPAVNLSSGFHADYHEPSDAPEKVDAEKVARVARLVAELAAAVADAPGRPRWTAAAPVPASPPSVPPRR
jgi:hypothetical protein